MRRWFQFRLRTALVLTAICCVPCGWLGANLRRYQTERRALAALGSVRVLDVARGQFDLC